MGYLPVNCRLKQEEGEWINRVLSRFVCKGMPGAGSGVYNRSPSQGAMKKRYIYALGFGIPGLFAAGPISVILFAGLMGVLWIYVFGDQPWPAIETVVSIQNCET